MSNKRLHLAWLLLGALVISGACSKRSSEGADQDDSEGTAVMGNEASIATVQAAARALAEPGPSVDYVAAQMEGAIKARTKSQALLYYDGYRATLTTPADQVTQIAFDLIEAKPTIRQLTAVFGEPEQIPKGMLYHYEAHATGSKIRILAEPVSLPGDEASLVRRIVLEGARVR